MINKNIQIWRGFDTPPTNYHIWFKNGIFSMFNGEAWVPIGSGGGVMRVEHIEDLPSDSPVGTLATVNNQDKKEYNVIDKFTLSDSYLNNEDPIPVKRWITKTAYSWPSNVNGAMLLTSLNPSIYCQLVFDYYYEGGYPDFEVGMMISNSETNFDEWIPLLYEDEQGQLKVNPEASILLGGLFNQLDFYCVGFQTYDEETGEMIFRDLTNSELEFFGQFFNYNESYSYEKNIDTNDLFFKTFKGWRVRNGVEILQSEDELNPEAYAGSVAAVVTDNYEEKWVKPSELTSLDLSMLNGILPVAQPADSVPDSELIGTVINTVIEELLKILLNLSPIEKIEIDLPWTHISQVPQELRLGEPIIVLLIPKHLNMQRAEPPMLALYGDDQEFYFGFEGESGAIISSNYDTGELSVGPGLQMLNALITSETYFWGGCLHESENGMVNLTHLLDQFMRVKTYSGESKTDFHIKDLESWKQLTSSKTKNLFVNSEGIKFKGYVNVDTIKGVDELYDSLNINEVAFAVPSTTLLGSMSNGSGLPLMSDSYVPWAVSGIGEGAIELSPDLFTVGLVLGGKTGFEVRTYFMLDKETPYVQCPDMLLLAKVEVNLRELVEPLLQAQLGISINIPETIVVSVGKVLRFGGGSSGGGGSLKTLDNGTYLNQCTQTGVVPYKQNSSQLPTSDYFTIFIQCPKDTDHNNYYHVQQTAYGRTGVAEGRVWTRLCLVNTNGNYDNFDWVEIPSADMLQSAFTDIFDALDDHSYQLSEAKTNISSLSHKYAYNYDMDKALNTGIIGYTTTCTKGVPGGIKENYTVLVFGSSDYDPNFRTVQQIAYGRTGSAANRVWTRLIFKHKNSTSKDEYHSWVEITNPAVDLSGIESDIANLYDTVIPGIEQDIANLESGLLTEGSVTVDKLGDDVKDMITNSGVPVANSSDALSADAVVGSFASIVIEGKTQLWVKNDTGWQEYGKESDPEEITNITDIL